MIKLQLTQAQFDTLEKLLDYEIDQEYFYQSNYDLEARDLEYLGNLIDLYEALYTKQARSMIEAFVFDDLVGSKKALLDELKGGK